MKILALIIFFIFMVLYSNNIFEKKKRILETKRQLLPNFYIEKEIALKQNAKIIK